MLRNAAGWDRRVTRARPTVRTTIVIDEQLDQALRARARDEDRHLRELIEEALRGYLGAPVSRSGMPVATVPVADGALTADVRALTRGLKAALPQLESLSASHAEILDYLDEIATEIGHRLGAGEQA